MTAATPTPMLAKNTKPQCSHAGRGEPPEIRSSRVAPQRGQNRQSSPMGDTAWLGSAADGERILGVQDGRPLEPDARQIGREHVFALRSHAALDPRDEVVERPLAHLAVVPAMAGRAHYPLHEQVAGAGGDRTAPVRLL